MVEQAGSQAPVQADELDAVWLMLDCFDELEGHAAPAELCGWCGERQEGSGYFVASQDERFRVCPICWGRAPDYLDLRREGLTHADALRRVSGGGDVPEFTPQRAA